MLVFQRTLLLFAVSGLACASGPPKLVGQPITKPIAVLVRVSDEAAKTDELGGTAGVVEAVSNGLSERGVPNQIFAADDDNPPAPRIEIWVEKWDAGHRGERAGASFVFGVVGQAATAGGYAVVCRIYRSGETKPAFTRRYSGIILGTSETASADRGESVGEAILRDSLRARR
jgi:hypothetical protein